MGEVMLMTPCNLCWYQRICMFPLALLLGMACYGSRRGAVYALPLAVAGSAVALYHTLLVAGAIPKTWIPCSARRFLCGSKLGNPPAESDSVAVVAGLCCHHCTAHRLPEKNFEMNSKKITVILLVAIVAVAFLFGMNVYQRRVQNAQAEKVSQSESSLVRAHSTVLGPQDAPVTIVEFSTPRVRPVVRSTPSLRI